jgi:hypothetical protein
MTLLDKVLVVMVTRDNPILLRHAFQSFSRYDPGNPCDFLIIDHESSKPEHLKVLSGLAAKHSVVHFPNDRVEVSFNRAWQENKQYRYYFFLHDDSAAGRPGWLKAFVDRLNSGYVEEVIQNTSLRKLPIGKVGALTHPWRDYHSILGYAVQCVFLKEVLDTFSDETPVIFRYSDCDRVLITNECLRATDGIANMQDYRKMKEQEPAEFLKLCNILDKYLLYYDLGVINHPYYPPGEHWNRICLLTEFMNSIKPLQAGFRTVGLEGDGYLEQIHGYEEPWSHKFIHHYGAPNFRHAIAKLLNTDSEEIRKSFNGEIFLLKCDQLIREYFQKRERA